MQRAIAAVSFGVGNVQAKVSCLDALLTDIRNGFSDRFDVYEAWTSSFLMKKMAGEGYMYQPLESLLADLAEKNYTEVIIMPTHLTPGEEYHNKILPAAARFSGSFRRLSVMEPVLTAAAPEDFAFLTAEMDVFGLQELAEGEEMVLMGHGSPHQHNCAYELLQAYADSCGWPVHIGVVEHEDFPNQSDVIRRLKMKGAEKLYLRPLLLAGGSHAVRDLAGEQPDSWKNVLRQAGFQVRYSVQGLGEQQAFRQLYINCLKKTINFE